LAGEVFFSGLLLVLLVVGADRDAEGDDDDDAEVAARGEVDRGEVDRGEEPLDDALESAAGAGDEVGVDDETNRLLSSCSVSSSSS
jgi:hypothetical protein